MDCTQVNLTTVGNKTTFYWSNSEMVVNVYEVSVADKDNQTVPIYQAQIPFGNNSWTVFGLLNNHEYFLNKLK